MVWLLNNSKATAGTSCFLQRMTCRFALCQYWFLISISLRPKWEAIPVLPRAHIHGQYWDLFLRGPVTLGPGQYWLLWHAWKLKGYNIMGYIGLTNWWEMYCIHIVPPLGFGGTIWTLSITLTIFRHAIKVNIALVPVWQDHVGRGVSILTMDRCPGQYRYGLPFRSQAEGNIALLT